MAIEAVGKNQTIKQEQKQSATTTKTKTKKKLMEGDCSVRNCSWTKKDAP